MGFCMSKELKAQTNADRKIGVQLRKELMQQRQHIKLLLLGSGESGKSTILKQMQILHKNGFTATQIQEFKQLICRNTVQCMAILVAAALKQTDSNLDNPELEIECNLVITCGESGKYNHELYLALKRLWADEGIRECYTQRHNLQLPDCAKHYFDSLDRINAADFEPSNEDILFTRVATTGVAQLDFEAKDCIFHVFDVGGQRSERRKWIHVFDDVAGVVFLTAVSEYDQTIREDENTNRLLDSLGLFASIINAEFFTKTTFILFLNKRDLFAAKIQTVPLTAVFPDFTGDQNYESSMIFMKEKFRDLNANEAKPLIIHETCATDTNQVQRVINGVIDCLIAKHFARTGIV